MRNQSIFTPDACTELLHRIRQLAPQNGSFSSMQHFFAAQAQDETSAIVNAYNTLSPQNQAQVKNELLELLHTETESAVKVYQLRGVSQEVYNLGEQTEEKYKERIWTQPI